MSQQGQTPTIEQMLALAKDESLLSQAGFSALAAAVQNHQITVNMNQNMGVPATSYTAKRVLFLVMMVDDSGSIRAADNEQPVREAHNLILDELEKSKEGGEILVFTRYLNGTILNAFVPIEQAERLNASNYNADGGTPLYDTQAEILAMAVAKAMEFSAEIVKVQVIMIALTDGKDEGSRNYTRPEQIKPIMSDVLSSEDPAFIALGWGINNGDTDFKEIFTKMGYNPSWVMTTGATGSEIRRGARVASRSAVLASKTAANFSTAAKAGLGGFLP